MAVPKTTIWGNGSDTSACTWPVSTDDDDSIPVMVTTWPTTNEPSDVTFQVVLVCRVELGTTVSDDWTSPPLGGVPVPWGPRPTLTLVTALLDAELTPVSEAPGPVTTSTGRPVDASEEEEEEEKGKIESARAATR
jgi:hypothetical protein